MPKAIVKVVLVVVVGLCLLTFRFPIFADVNTNVFVPPRPSDLQLMTSINPDNPTYAQAEDIEVEITYGSSLNFAAPMTIVGKWSQGTIEGQPYPSEDILDYVVGSATSAYGSTAPVIDSVNRTVTWTVSSFPAQLTDQTVSFHLKTNFNYTASQNVSFTIGAYLTDSETTINATDITRIYQYNPLGPTPTPTSTPVLTPTSSPSTGTTSTSTPTSTPIPTATPTPAPPAFIIKTVDIQTVSSKNITLYLTTNQRSTAKIIYGTTPGTLNKSVSDNSLDVEHTITLSGLIPDTKYYFKVIAVNRYNKTNASDIFTVKTAVISEAPAIALNTFTVTSANKILVAPVNLSSDEATKQQQKTLVIPQSTVYDLRFALTKVKPVKSIKVVLRKKKMVLGDSVSMLTQIFGLNNQDPITQEDSSEIMPTAANGVNVKEARMTEIQPGIFYGRLVSNLPLGEYELFAIASDNDGNISETKLSNVKVINRLTVFSKDIKQLIENARIYLSFYSSGAKRYEPLLPTLISIINPSYTDSMGKSSIVLPQGKYRVLVSDLGYKDKIIDFTIGIGKNDGFPTVYLEKESSFNLASTLIYYGRSIRDVYIYYTMQYFTALSKSLRFFNLINAMSLGLFVIVTLLSFKFRTHISLGSMFSYLIYHIRKLSGQNISAAYLEGNVLEEKTKIPIGKAQVYLIDKNTHQTVRQTATNINGHFFFKLNDSKDYEILAIKRNYEITPFNETSTETHGNKPVNILLKKSESRGSLPRVIVTKFIEAPIGFLFEYLLVSSFMFELTSIPYFGFQRTLPFLIISMLNLLLWVLHLKQKTKPKKAI